MKSLFNFVSDNAPFLLVSAVVLSLAANLLVSTAAYLRV